VGDLILSVVEFPSSGSGFFSFIGRFVYILISAMHGGGALSYGLAVIFFCVILKLMLLPLDFGNRYFTRKNAMQMAKFKPEEEQIKEQYAGDPLAMNRARQELYRKNGYKMGGFCLFTVLNMVVMMIVFISVFQALNAVAAFNVNRQFIALQAIHQEYIDPNTGDFTATEDNPTEYQEFGERVTELYDGTRVSFLWIANIWRPDTPWSSTTLSFSAFRTMVAGTEDSIFHDDVIILFYEEHLRVAEFNNEEWSELTNEQRREVREKYLEMLEDVYYTIFHHIDPTQRNWNGLLLLVALAGVTTYFSAVLNARMMNAAKKNAPDQKEREAQYSMRKVKNQADGPTKPQIDPQMIQKMMKFVLPIVMIVITLNFTAALAIYFITNAAMSTASTAALAWPVDKLLKWQEKRKAEKSGTPEADTEIINPHAKYFKKKK